MTRWAWVNRCARRLKHLTGASWPQARQDAARLADEQAEKNGASALAWASPEATAETRANDENGDES